MRKGEIDFTGELGVDAVLDPLDMRPQFLAVTQESRRTRRQQNLGMDDPAPPRKVVDLPGPFVLQPFTCPVGCRLQRRVSLRALDYLHMEVKARHTWSFSLLDFRAAVSRAPMFPKGMYQCAVMLASLAAIFSVLFLLFAVKLQ